jgi:hypothetical protein
MLTCSELLYKGRRKKNSPFRDNFRTCAETLPDGKPARFHCKLLFTFMIGYVDYVMAKRENLNKLNLSLLKTLTLKEELVKEI